VLCNICIKQSSDVECHITTVCFDCCSDVGIYDRVVIQELLKTVAQSHQLDTSSQRDFKG